MNSGRLVAADALDSLSWSRALLSGFVASVAMLFAFAVAYAGAWLLAGVLPVDQPLAGTLGQWLAGLTQNAFIDLAQPNLYAALAVYFAGGLLWAALYAAVFEPRLGGAAWQRGLVYALVPWLFSLLVFLPLVGGGLLGLGLGAGPLPIIGNLLLHVVYGITLGALYGPGGDELLDGDHRVASRDDLWASHRSETGAVAGMALGLLAGATVGLVGVLAAGAVGGPPFGASDGAGLHPLATLLAGALVGGALGALAGSLLGMSSTAPRQDG
ncbi:MAG: hypothetical protein ACRDJN_27705 [Chloroflexota bacterium]